MKIQVGLIGRDKWPIWRIKSRLEIGTCSAIKEHVIAGHEEMYKVDQFTPPFIPEPTIRDLRALCSDEKEEAGVTCCHYSQLACYASHVGALVKLYIRGTFLISGITRGQLTFRVLCHHVDPYKRDSLVER